MAKLYIVGTPIGNTRDITLRAIDTLKNADYIACEDTRHSRPLLEKYEIRSKLIAYHKHNEVECAAKLTELIRVGNNVALITDAGMPCVSDPGAEVIALCREQGVETELVPGPSALTGALALSGIKSKGFTFLGFLPEKKCDKAALLSKTAYNGLPLVIYVAPHDVKKTAAYLFETLGERKVYIARELTKIYESVMVTSLSDFQCEERGEMVMIIEPPLNEDNPLNKLSVKEHVLSYIKSGLDKKTAVKKTASDRGVPKNDVYSQTIDLDI